MSGLKKNNNSKRIYRGFNYHSLFYVAAGFLYDERLFPDLHYLLGNRQDKESLLMLYFLGLPLIVANEWANWRRIRKGVLDPVWSEIPFIVWFTVLLDFFIPYPVGVIGLIFYLFALFFLFPKDDSKSLNTATDTMQRNNGVFGDAGFANHDEINAAGLIAPSAEEFYNGVYLGSAIDCYGERGEVWSPSDFLTYRGENSILTIAPAGSGKNTAAIMPTLQICKDSVFVLDMKGENFWVTRRQRQDGLGQKVIALNPFNIWGEELGYEKTMTHCFNPLLSLSPESSRFIEEVDSIAEALILNTGSSDGGHFDDRARQLVACVIAYICTEASERDTVHLGRMREIVSLDEMRFVAWATKATKATKSPILRVRNIASRYAALFNEDGKIVSAMLSKENSSVLNTVNKATAWLDNPNIQNFLSRSDINFSEMKKEPITVYLMVPAEFVKIYSPLMRLVIQSFFNAMKRKIRAAGDRQILAVFDEVNQLGRMEVIEQAPAIMRGFGVRVWNIFQDCNQMQRTYDKNWQSFEANADIIQIFTPNDQLTAEHFSKRIGNTTVVVTSVSENFSKGADSKPSSSTGYSRSPHALPFLSSTALYGLAKDRALVFAKNVKYPILTTRCHYYEPHQTAVFNDFGADYLPMPHVPHHNPNYPSDILAYEKATAEKWRQHWLNGGLDGRYWEGAPIP